MISPTNSPALDAQHEIVQSMTTPQLIEAIRGCGDASKYATVQEYGAEGKYAADTCRELELRLNCAGLFVSLVGILFTKLTVKEYCQIVATVAENIYEHQL